MQDKATVESEFPCVGVGSGQEGPVPLQWALPLPFMWLLFVLGTSVL